jgi:hypothetical protein
VLIYVNGNINTLESLPDGIGKFNGRMSSNLVVRQLSLLARFHGHEKVWANHIECSAEVADMAG